MFASQYVRGVICVQPLCCELLYPCLKRSNGLRWRCRQQGPYLTHIGLSLSGAQLEHGQLLQGKQQLVLARPQALFTDL